MLYVIAELYLKYSGSERECAIVGTMNEACMLSYMQMNRLLYTLMYYITHILYISQCTFIQFISFIQVCHIIDVIC